MIDTANGPTPGIVAAPAGDESVGGGTWHYGAYDDANGYKHCWSFYYHPTKYHGATARFEYATSKAVEANAGLWANAEPDPFSLKAAPGQCQVFWRVYP